MNITLKNDLDPIFETICLLSLCHTENWQEETIQSLQEFGIGDEAFFQKHFKAVNRYVKTFQKYKSSDPEEEAFFQEITDDALMLLIMLAVENRPFLEDSSPMDLQKLRSFLAWHLTDTLDHTQVPSPENIPSLQDETSIIEFLENAEMKAEEKWCMLNLLRKPDVWLERLFHLVRINLPAYQKAKDAVEKPLEKLLLRCPAHNHADFMKIAETCGQNPVIFPTLASPLTQVVFYSCGYLGLLCEYLMTGKSSSEFSKDTILHQLKSLSDRSKLDILCTLKSASKYNLELAQALGISPSTTSHHMNALLICGFVTVEKKDGKVYYCLSQDSIRQFISGLEQLLL